MRRRFHRAGTGGFFREVADGNVRKGLHRPRANSSGVRARHRRARAGRVHRIIPVLRRGDETAIRDALVELYVDGGAFAAVPIGLRSTGEDDGRQIGEITLVDDGILLMDLALRWCAAEAGRLGHGSGRDGVHRRRHRG